MQALLLVCQCRMLHVVAVGSAGADPSATLRAAIVGNLRLGLSLFSFVCFCAVRRVLFCVRVARVWGDHCPVQIGYLCVWACCVSRAA